MIRATAYLLIQVILVGLLVLALIWVLGAMFGLAVPLVAQQGLGLVALILIVLRLCQIWGATEPAP